LVPYHVTFIVVLQLNMFTTSAKT